MKKNKTLTLLSTLTESEHKKFSSVLKNNQKSKLLKLYKLLCKQLKSNKETPIASLFKQLYREKYSSKKDYQIRNDLRYLTQAINQFLIDQHLEQKLKTDDTFKQVQLLEILQKKEAKELYEIEWKKAYTTAQKNNDPAFIKELFILQTQHYLQYPQWDQATFEQFLDLLGKAQSNTVQLFLKDFIGQEHKRIYAQANLKTLQPESTQFEFNTPIHEYVKQQEEEDVFVRYTKLTSKVYYTSGDLQLQTLKEALDLIPIVSFLTDSHKKKTIASINLNIGLHYFLKQNYESALIHYQKCLEFSDLIPKGQLEGYIYNYISALLHSRRHQTALATIAQHQNLLFNSPMTKRRILALKAMCFIDMGEVGAAENCLPESIKQNAEDVYFYFRLILVLCYSLRKEWDLALNEVSNYLRMLNYQENQMIEFQSVGQFLKQFLKIKTQLYDSKQEELAKLKALKTTMIQHYETHPRELNLPSKWLLRTLP